MADPEDRSALWLDQERARIEEDARSTSKRVDALIRTGKLSAVAATSFMNDSGYAYGAMRDLINVARSYYIERDSAMAELERLLSLDEEELDEAMIDPPKNSGSPVSKNTAPRPS